MLTRITRALAVVILLLPACSRNPSRPVAPAAPSPAVSPSGTGTPSSTPSSTPSPDSATRPLVIALRQGLKVLNPYLEDESSASTNIVAKAVLPSLVVVSDDLSLQDQLEDGPPRIDAPQPFTVTWHLKKEARWDDGSPITADDVKATLDYILDPDSPVSNRTGYELVTEFRVVDAKTFTVVFREPYASYRLLWSGPHPVLQKKAIDQSRKARAEAADSLTSSHHSINI